MDNNQNTTTQNNSNNLPDPTINSPNASPQNIIPNADTNLTSGSVPTPSPTQNQPSPDPVFTNKGHRKKKIIKITLAVVISVLFIGAIVFAVLLVISSQPQNMMASSLNKLFTSKQVSVDGNINTTIKNANISLNVEFNAKQSDPNNSVATTAQINIPGFNQPIVISFEEIAIEYGTIYLKVGGISSAIDTYSEITNGSGVQKNNPTIDMISGIASSIEDRWIKISYEELRNGSDQRVSDTYNCITDKISNKSSYTDELTNLYKEYPFLNMEQENSFYNISLNTNHLTNYINSIPNTKIAKDINNCAGNTNTSTSEVSEDNIKDINNYLPKILVKFNQDGLFSYELSEVKVSDDTDYYTIDSDLKFNYTNIGTISEPTDNIISIKDLIKEITSRYMQIQSNYNNSIEYNDYSQETETIEEYYEF